MDRSPQGSGDSGQGNGGRPTNGPSSPNTAGLAGMGVQFLVVILLFLFVGKWLDARLGTAPLLLILGVFCGAGVSIFAMYRKVFPSEKSRPGTGPGARPQ
jgi:F0F1-type ATP synthase assembly protein I